MVTFPLICLPHDHLYTSAIHEELETRITFGIDTSVAARYLNKLRRYYVRQQIKSMPFAIEHLSGVGGCIINVVSKQWCSSLIHCFVRDFKNWKILMVYLVVYKLL